MRKATYLLTLAAAVVALFVTRAPLCAEQGASASTNGRTQSMLNKRYAIMARFGRNTDTPKIGEGVVTKIYVHTTGLKDDAVSAEVHDGVVTLTGTVIDESHKALAQKNVADLPGIIRVDNQLTVRAGDAAGTTAISTGKKVKNENTTAAPEPAEQVVTEKKDDVSATASVVTQGGGITSTGTVANAADKPRSSKLMADTGGATPVNNPMTGEAAKSQ